MTSRITAARLTTRLALAVLMTMFAAVVWAGAAYAGAFGELGQVGSFGTGAGQFSWPSDLVVDPLDNSVYVLDEPTAIRSGFGPASFRIQKFGAGLGAPVASVTVPTPEEPVEHHLRAIDAMAIDTELHRLYVLQSFEEGGEAKAAEIYAFSTEASGGTLPPAPHVPEVEVETGLKEAVFYKFPKPSESGGLTGPHGLAVDPTTHDLIVLGGNGSVRTILQRIAAGTSPYATGTLSGTPFQDTTKLVTKSGSASSVAVGPEGSLYLSVHVLPGAGTHPGVMKLSSDFTTASVVRSDTISSSVPTLTGGTEGGVLVDYGPQVAVSPDGSTVYAVETDKPENAAANPPEAGSYEVRGMSTADGSQQVVFGGGTAPHCVIASSSNAVAAGAGGVVYALDEGSVASGGIFGFDLVKFGPDGSGCPTPTASFAIGSDSSSPKVIVKKGEIVSFTASSAGLNGEVPVELQWDLDGSGKYETKITGTPPSLHEEEEYLKPGVYPIGLKVFLENNGNFGNPPPVTREIEVVAAPPRASFEASTTDPKSEETVEFNGELSSDPTGLCAAGHGCVPTNQLKEYTWKFGDGQTVKKTWPEDTYSRKFTNSGHQSRQESVTLTVTNEEGVQSTPETQTLAIQGTPETITTTTTTNPPPPPPPPGGGPVVTTTTPTRTSPPAKPLTNAQKLAKALKACTKIKAKKKRAACVAAAKRKYAPKPKKKHGKK